MPNGTKSGDQPSGPSGDKTFRFKNYMIRKKNHEPYGAPYFRLKSHEIKLKQNGPNIDVTAQLRVKSHGFKTDASDPKGEVPRIYYTVKFGNEVPVEVQNFLDVWFDCNTQNDMRTQNSSIMARDADDVVEVCWDFANRYRVVKCGSK